MEKFTWEAFRSKRIAVRCRTEAEAREFLEFCRRAGFTWGNFAEIIPDKYTHYGEYSEYTCYIAGCDLPWMQYRSLSWVLDHEYTVRFADEVMRELCEAKATECGHVSIKLKAVSEPPKETINPHAARWRDAEADKPTESGEYFVIVRWIADGAFHTGKEIAMFNAVNGGFGNVDTLEGEYVITHWLDGVPPAPEVVVR